MTRKLKKVPQPPIDRLGRASESRPLVLGVLAAVLGAGMILWGFQLHKVKSHDGSTKAYSDYELIGLIRTGELERSGAAASGQGAGAVKTPGDAPPDGLQTPPKGKGPKLCPT
jgi:hypothetical protein